MEIAMNMKDEPSLDQIRLFDESNLDGLISP